MRIFKKGETIKVNGSDFKIASTEDKTNVGQVIHSECGKEIMTAWLDEGGATYLYDFSI